MGAQTRESLAAVTNRAQSVTGVTQDAVSGLFQAGRAIAAYPSLLSALADPGHDPGDRSTLLDGAMGSLPAASRQLLDHVVELSWSAPIDLLAGIEHLGVRVSAGFADVDTVASQLLQASRIIRGHAELQLALSDKRATTESKVSIVEAIFSKKVDPASLAVIAHVVAQPRGRRASDALQEAAELVLDHDGRGLAEVQVAQELSASQQKDVGALLQKKFGRDHYLDVVMNPEVIGGARIRVGDLVMDGSVSTQLNEMRLQLAG